MAATAVGAAMCGALATVPVQSPLRAVLLLVFVLAGVGSAVMCWMDYPVAVTVAAIVGISVASLMAVAVAMAWLQFFHPVPSCLLIAALVAASGLFRLHTLRVPTGRVVSSW
ncbi:hypothetical protein ACQI4F_18875 [Mycolicibacterium vaccae]|uniref:hypothetical protein n=1 Tax=Mycolicibacterium vaccae TaxID=1810 RepID=UPI003CFB7FC0